MIISTIIILSTFRYQILSSNDTQTAFEALHCVGDCGTESAAYSLLNACVWLRVLYFLRLNRILGPLLKIVIQMTKDILKFLFLLILVILTFACVGKIEFSVP